MRWLSEQSKGKVLSSHCTVEVKDQTGSSSTMSVLDAQKQKHPAPHCPPDITLLKCESLSPCLDLEVTGTHVHHLLHAHVHHFASCIQGSAGASGTDACHWQDVLLRYGAHSEHLHDSIATLIRRLSNTVTPWDDIRALVVCRLVALDKCPGVWPTGVCETLRRTAGKTVCTLTRCDLEDICGTSQLCGGVCSGIESALHTDVMSLMNTRRRDGVFFSLMILMASTVSIVRQFFGILVYCGLVVHCFVQHLQGLSPTHCC